MKRLFQPVECVCFVSGKYINQNDQNVYLFASKIPTSKRTVFYQLFSQLHFCTPGVDPITVARLIVQVTWYNTVVLRADVMSNILWTFSKPYSALRKKTEVNIGEKTVH